MKELGVDIETFSSVNLTKAGVHKYVESPDFELMLFQYSVDGGPAQHVSPHLGEKVPPHIVAALTDPSVLKTAWNASFERTCLAKWIGDPMPAEQWQCSMVLAATLGLPMDLERAGRALKIKNKKRSSKGMRFFCIPCKPTAANGMRTRNLPHHDPDLWKLFVEYGDTDVDAEQEILARCRKIPVPADVAKIEHELWCLDQRANDRGVRIDLTLAENAVELNAEFKARCHAEAVALTGLANPNSVKQLIGWLNQAEALDLETLNKKQIPPLLASVDSDVVRRVLELRLEMAKTSTQKYVAMQNRACADDFFRGGAQFYGARTGRWAHRGVQFGNLPHNKVADILEAREMLRQGRVKELELLWGVPSFILSQLIRTAFIPDDDDSEFLVVDFSAIEAVKLAWLADCKWRLDVFRGDGKIYEHSASRAFKVPWSEFQAYIDRGKKHPLRSKGKVLELACFPESTMVLCDVGLVPIRNVTTDMRLWDGVEWVRHDGVVERGEQDVIEYCGLEATADHRVWVEGSNEPVEFGAAKADRARLIRSEQGGSPIRVVGCGGAGATLRGKTSEPENLVHVRLRGAGSGPMEQLDPGPYDPVQSVLAGPRNGDPAPAGSCPDAGTTTVCEPEGQRVRELRWEGGRVPVPLHTGGWAVGALEHRPEAAQPRSGSDREQRALRPGEPSVGDAFEEQPQQEENGFARGLGPGSVAVCVHPGDSAPVGRVDERADSPGRLDGCGREAQELARDQGKTRKAQVYDILNAGPRNRFTAGGFLVHNCGYGGSEGALVAMGALETGLTLGELKPMAYAWRDASLEIAGATWREQPAGLWELMNDAALGAVRTGRLHEVKHGIEFTVDKGILFMRIPSGRKLAYMQPRIVEGKFGQPCIEFSGLDQVTNQWTRIQTYGPKLVENADQASCRDLLRDKILRIDKIPTYRDTLRFTVHDEGVWSVKKGKGSIKELEEIFAEPVKWAPGLPLNSAGFATPVYMKEID